MSRQRKIDILDLLPADALEAVDKLGYEFLSERGYSTEGARESAAARDLLAKELKERGERLTYSGAVDKDTGRILIWFTIHKGRRRIARSRALRLVPKPKETDDDT